MTQKPSPEEQGTVPQLNEVGDGRGSDDGKGEPFKKYRACKGQEAEEHGPL